MTEAGSVSVPKPPTGLQKPGKRLWKAVVSSFELREDELVLLEAASRLADEISLMDSAMEKMTVLVLGSKQQLRANPLLAEARAHRLALGRILGQLGLADAIDTDGSARSTAGRRMARARWSGR
jgi:hypothetical protein